MIIITLKMCEVTHITVVTRINQFHFWYLLHGDTKIWYIFNLFPQYILVSKGRRKLWKHKRKNLFHLTVVGKTWCFGYSHYMFMVPKYFGPVCVNRKPQLKISCCFELNISPIIKMLFYFWETRVCVKRMNLSKLTITVDFWHLNWHLYWPDLFQHKQWRINQICLQFGPYIYNYNLKVKMKL